MRSEPVIWAVFLGGFGVAFASIGILALKELSPVCKALLVSLPGVRWSHLQLALSAVDGPIIATDAILNLASCYSMVARPDDVRALVDIARKILKKQLPRSRGDGREIVEAGEARKLLQDAMTPARHYLLTMRPLFVLFPDEQKSAHPTRPPLA
ncbi:hypothetical protein V8C42DRAFT_39097 [Trichoderma barbatum]